MEIQRFVPRHFWEVSVVLSPHPPDVTGMPVTVTIEALSVLGRIFDESLALSIAERTRSSMDAGASVVSLHETETVVHPPVGLRTVELLRVASVGLGIGPQRCMAIAEKLYMGGQISVYTTSLITLF